MRTFSVLRCLTLLVLALISCGAHASQTVTVFTANATTGNPQVLVAGPDGLLYFGSTQGVFRLSGSGVASLVAGTQAPVNQLIAGYDGYLYGTTSQSVFRLRTDGTLTTIATTSLGDLLLASDGNLYGAGPDGTYRLSMGGALTKISSYRALNLAEGAGGNFFGAVLRCTENATYCSGAGMVNFVFAMTSAGVVTETSQFNCGQGTVQAPMTGAADGTLWGVTANYGFIPETNDGCTGTGGVFSVDAGGRYTQHASFPLGQGSSSPLLIASDGTLFGIRDFECEFYYDCHLPQLFRYRPQTNRVQAAIDSTITGDEVTDLDANPPPGKLVQTADGTIYGIEATRIYRLKRPTTLTGQGTMSVDPLTGAVTLNPKVTLTDDMARRGIAGQTVRFYRKGVQLCVQQTDVTGKATCKMAVKDHTGGFDAFSDETDVYAATSVHSPLLCVSGLNCQ